MEFRILGPLEVIADGVALQLGTPRQRTLLGMLLIWAGDVVSQDRWSTTCGTASRRPPHVTPCRATSTGYVRRPGGTRGA